MKSSNKQKGLTRVEMVIAISVVVPSGKNITINGVNYGPNYVEVSSFNDGVLVRYQAP